MRLFECNDVSVCTDLLKIYSNFFFSAVQNHQMDPIASTADGQGKIVFQMMMTKVISIQALLKGIKFTANNGATLNRIIDPSIIAAHSRSIFETTAMFNLIYVATQTPDEKTILYNLWVHAGLAFRQRFQDVITTSENRKKADEEKEIMRQLVQEIESTMLYGQLDAKEQGKIQTRLKEKEYLLEFEGTRAQFIHWHDTPKIRHFRAGFFDNLYTYWSLYAHPSNVAVFQFAEMFRPGEEQYEHLTVFTLKMVFPLISAFIADYIKLFPGVLNTFNSLSLVDQIVIDFHNRYLRGYEFSINDTWKELG